MSNVQIDSSNRNLGLIVLRLQCTNTFIADSAPRGCKVFVIFLSRLLPQARVHDMRVSLDDPWHAFGVFQMVLCTYHVIPERLRYPLMAAFSATSTTRKKNRII
jgi:hypothetical protein